MEIEFTVVILIERNSSNVCLNYIGGRAFNIPSARKDLIDWDVSQMAVDCAAGKGPLTYLGFWSVVGLSHKNAHPLVYPLN